MPLSWGRDTGTVRPERGPRLWDKVTLQPAGRGPGVPAARTYRRPSPYKGGRGDKRAQASRRGSRRSRA